MRDEGWKQGAYQALLVESRVTSRDLDLEPLCLSQLLLGHQEGGEQGFERYARTRGTRLTQAERETVELLRRSRAGLWRIEQVEPHGVWARSVPGSEQRCFLRNPFKGHGLRAGRVVLAWTTTSRSGLIELPVPPFPLPEVAGLVERVQRHVTGDSCAQPGLLPRIVCWLGQGGELDVAPAPAERFAAEYLVQDAEAVRRKLEAHRQLRRGSGPGRFEWAPQREAPAEAWIELRTVRLSVSAQSPEQLERAQELIELRLGRLVRHLVDRLQPELPETADPVTAYARQVRERVARWLDEGGAGAARRTHCLPPMAHEVMYRLIPGLRETLAAVAGQLASSGGSTFLPPEVVEAPQIKPFLERCIQRGRRSGQMEGEATQDARSLMLHLAPLVNFELHRRKSFWVDESLAWMLGCTRLDLDGASLRLPFPCSAFVFTDESTLELGESLLAGEQHCDIRGLPLVCLTVFVTQRPAEGTERSIELAFVFDSGTEEWPYLLSRELRVRPADRLEQILDSRPAGSNPDPSFRAPEVRKLVHLVVNALLYATTSHLEPILLDAPPRRHGSQASGEPLIHLAGKLRIATIRQYRELERTRPGRKLMQRFMVRGHWRRAAAGWADQRPRWIEPHWKGPELAEVIERNYRLEP